MGNEPLFYLRRSVVLVLAVSVGITTAALIMVVTFPDSPEKVVEQFLRARYARNSKDIYALASSSDRAERTLAEFVEVNPPFPKPFQPGVNALAEAIRFLSIDSEQTGDQARVTVRATLPNGTDGNLNVLLHAAEADRAFNEVGSSWQVVRRIRADARADRLPMVEVTETVNLIREGVRWRVIMGWDSDLLVTLGTVVADGVPIQFTITTEPDLRLRPGETGRATFAVRNTSDQSLRIVATHVYTPPAAQIHIELIQCFCFIEKRIEPDETVDLTLVFRLGWDVPSAMDMVSITYRYGLAEERP